MKEFEVIRDGATPNKALYQCLMASVHDVEGLFAEFGVHEGGTFDVIMEMAKRQGRKAHAFDSFRGMPEPERAGDELYPKGTFDMGGPDEFMRKYPDALVHPGFMPNSLPKLGRFWMAFAHVDVDHYLTTFEVLEWVWERMMPGGIMACHDFRFGQTCRAAGAINDWMSQRPSDSPVVYYPPSATEAEVDQIEKTLKEALRRKDLTLIGGQCAEVTFSIADIVVPYEGLSDMTIWFRKAIK